MTIVFLLFLACLRATVASPLDACPAGVPQDQYLQINGSYCYQFNVFRRLTHSAARAECEHNGGSLVLVKDQDTQNYIYNELVHTYHNNNNFFNRVWIGLNDIATESSYVWEDGTKLDYANWADQDGPSSHSFLHNVGHDSKDCVVVDMLTSGRWREVECESSDFLILFSSAESHPFVCQYVASTLLPPTTIVSVEVPTPVTGYTVVSVVNPCPPIVCPYPCNAPSFAYDPVTACPICNCNIV